MVILGAGASKAALPSGDKNGRSLPVMDEIVPMLGLENQLRSLGIDGPFKNFEKLYGVLAARDASSEAVKCIECAVRSYFSAIQLPDTPTIYDFLVLSLRSKDLIATFNWDPLLVQAASRNAKIAEPPNLLFLHGNVAVGYCTRHGVMIQGLLGEQCPQCSAVLAHGPLLFPIASKDYTACPEIHLAWKELEANLRGGYALTVFGYGAPVSDAAAVELLRGAWGDPGRRWFEDIEIIDIKDEDSLYETWGPFIHKTHWSRKNSISGSSIFRHPRRSCEANHARFYHGKWLSGKTPPFPEFKTLQDWHLWLRPRLDAELARLRPKARRLRNADPLS